MPRFSAPVAILVILLAGCTGAATAPSSSIEPTGSPAASAPAVPRATFALTITGGAAAGSYTADPTTTLDACTHGADGSWRLLYQGGEPVLALDFLVGPGAWEPDKASHVAAEISTPDETLKFDPADMRGGDPKGRSTATVEIQPALDITTFVVAATTPDRVGGDDGGPVQVKLTVSCPN